MNEQQNQNNQNKQPLSVSAPPPEITIRTLESDIESVQESGGEIPIGKPFSPSETKIETSEEKKTIETKIDIPGYTGPEKPIFPTEGTISDEVSSKKTTTIGKIIGIIIGILVIGLGFGILGYYVIFPLILK
jgi:hypothetical protein